MILDVKYLIIALKILYAPNINFNIHQLSLNKSGQLLAVAGAHEVGVVVLPHGGQSKFVRSHTDCRHAPNPCLLNDAKCSLGL